MPEHEGKGEILTDMKPYKKPRKIDRLLLSLDTIRMRLVDLKDQSDKLYIDLIAEIDNQIERMEKS